MELGLGLVRVRSRVRIKVMVGLAWVSYRGSSKPSHINLTTLDNLPKIC